MDNFCSEHLLNEPVVLEQNQVHVWPIDLTLPEEKIDQLFKLLKEEERLRANRFHFPQDRVRFIAARGMLRILLARYLSAPAEQLQFLYGPYGKPSLMQAPALQFNLSHANNKALLAVTLAPAVGVDIEYCEKELDIDGIAKRFFSANEYQIIQTLIGESKRKAFFTAWVRKEAFLKALGAGLSYSLEKVEVNLLPGQPAEIIALHDPAQSLADWSLFALEAPAGYEAALVVRGKGLELKIWPESSVA